MFDSFEVPGHPGFCYRDVNGHVTVYDETEIGWCHEGSDGLWEWEMLMTSWSEGGWAISMESAVQAIVDAYEESTAAGCV